MKPHTLTGYISDKFKFWTFVSITLILLLHSYNLQNRYLRPWSTVGERMTPTAFFEYFVANGVLRFLIPLLFAISGFLYALRDQAPYWPRVRKRVRTLLAPYLIWSALAMVMTYMMETGSYTRELVRASGVAYLDEGRLLLHNYHWYELLWSWLAAHIAYQFWFIRVLFFYNVSYPVLCWCITHKIVRWIYFLGVGYLWVNSYEAFFVNAEGLFFFSIGILIQKAGLSIETPAGSRVPAFCWGTIFLASVTANTWLAFNGQGMLRDKVFAVLTWMHILVVISGMLTAWYGFDGLISRCMRQRYFIWLAAFSFFAYAVHAPAISYAIDLLLHLLRPVAGYRILAFLFLPLIILVLSVGLGTLVRKWIPATYGILTGGRGFV